MILEVGHVEVAALRRHSKRAEESVGNRRGPSSRLYPFGKEEGVGYDHRQSPPQRGDDANPTNHDATLAQPLRATVLKAPMASRPGAARRSDPHSRQKNR